MHFPEFIPPAGPLDRIRVTSQYGERIRNEKKEFHPGWDIRTSWPGESYDGLIRAHEDIVIIRIVDARGYRYIDAIGASLLQYRYGHVAPLRADLCAGSRIVTGDIFAAHGLYGTTELHLHFECHHQDPALRKSVDPVEFFGHIPKCDSHGVIQPVR